jgi:hypothetical protein
MSPIFAPVKVITLALSPSIVAVLMVDLSLTMIMDLSPSIVASTISALVAVTDQVGGGD